jgi:hypothetical protein
MVRSTIVPYGIITFSSRPSLAIVTLQPFGLEGRIKWLDLFPVEVKALHVVDFKEENYRENNKEQMILRVHLQTGSGVALDITRHSPS